MAIYRGNGGAGDATGGVTVNEVTALVIRAEDATVESEASATASAASATSSATSASASATSATNSATSASQSATSATNSANSATASATSATNSANSATASASSATASAASAANAASSATDAQTAQVAAETAQTASEAAQAAAATSASNASTSASSASTSASNASSSATASANSATASASSATDSANSATSSANSATASAASASSAASSAAAAAASLDSFDDRYLGAKASAPTLDNDGNALVTGALYYDTTEGGMFVYDGAQWIAASSASQAILTVYKFTATSGQTTFTGVDDNAATLSYTAGSIIVTLNGIFLEGGDDYTATDGVNVVLSAGATTSDEINIYAFNTFDVANVQAIGDDRYVRLTTDQTVAGIKTLSSNPVLSAGTANGVTYLNGSKVLTSGSALTFDGTNFATTGSGTLKNLLLSSGTLPAAGNPSIALRSSDNVVYHQSGSANNIVLLDSAQNTMQSIGATAQIWNISNAEQMRLTSTGLGIGTSSPSAPLDIVSSSTGGTTIELDNTSTGGRNWVIYSSGSGNSFGAGKLAFYDADAGQVRLLVDSSGNLGLGVTPSGWGTAAAYRAIDIGLGSSLANMASTTTTDLISNAYYSGSNWIYKNTASASKYRQSGGAHSWDIAPSGTAGGTISFTQAMTLDASGNLLVGTTSASSKLTVNSEISIGADGDNRAIIGYTPSRFYIGTRQGGTNYFDTVSVSSGNVGIGLSPAYKLDVYGSGEVLSRFVRSAGSNALFLIQDPTTTTAPYIGSYGNAMAFGRYGGGESARIDSSGNLLVGATSGPSNFKFYSPNGAMLGDQGSGVYVSPSNQNTINSYWGTDTDSNSLWLQYRGYNDGFTRFRDTLIGNGKGSSIAHFVGSSGNLSITGALSKGSGSFKIDHPLKPDTHHLVHSFVESPQADNIYRGKTTLVGGRAEVSIDTVAGMTEGTFVALNREVQCFTSNESDWDAVRGSVTGNILTIECQNINSTATISWLVIGERQDKHMYNTDWTDENGKVIVEPVKPEKDPLEVQAELEKARLDAANL